jgi:tripartite ATP-independent transporter DctM subunit
MSIFLILDLLSMTLLMVLGVPVVYAVLGAALIYFLGHPDLSTLIMMQQVQTPLRSFPLLSIPFFILAGTIMAKGGIADKIMSFAYVYVGHWRGGLAQVGVLNSLVMGSMSGSAVADAAVDSRILVPQMRKRGYSLGFSAAIAAASSVIAPILPPSTSLILYGLLGQVSVAALFLGGVLPALLIAVGLMGLVAIISRVRSYGAMRELKTTWKEKWNSLIECFWALMMPVILVGGIRTGLFTITELAAMAALYTLVVSMVIYRTMSLVDLWEVLKDTARTSATVLIIIGASGAFSYIFAIEQVPLNIITWLSTVTDNSTIVLLIVCLGLTFLGMVIEGAAIMIIGAPILVGIATHFGIDPVHMGVLVVVTLTLSTLTPPVGIVMFTVCSMTGCRVETFLKEMLPFYAVLFFILVLLVVFPQLITTLPNWLSK